VRPARLTGTAGTGTAGSPASPAGCGLPPPLTALYEQEGLPAWGLPSALADVYGGDLGFRQPCVYANFVASVDGVTALGPEYPSSGSAISGHAPADRFVMGLLRACADVVLIGAGTLRATPGHRWTPSHVCPAAAESYAALRRTRGLSADPLLAVVTARGDVPAGHPALRAGALILTTATAARRLHGRLPPACTIADLGEGPELPPAGVLAAARDRGGNMVLTEGGPRLLGQLAAGGLLDELFLTISPVLAGRGDTARPGLVAGLELLPGRNEAAELLTVRRHGSYLFLRYATRGTLFAPEPAAGSASQSEP
jgi:riboflavin biosynthesis pyrimidine reductase